MSNYWLFWGVKTFWLLLHFVTGVYALQLPSTFQGEGGCKEVFLDKQTERAEKILHYAKFASKA
jgi:hypothetical protein